MPTASDDDDNRRKPLNVRKVHVPTAEEVNQLHAAQVNAILRYRKAVALAEDTPDVPESDPYELAELKRQNRLAYWGFVRWLAANDVLRHRNAVAKWLSRRYARAAEVFRLFNEGALN